MQRFAKTLGLAVGLVTLFGAASVSAQNSTGVGGKPANPRADNPRTSSIFVHEILPGQTTTDTIRIINNTPETKDIEVYATDALIASGGAFSCEQKVDKAEQAGGWIKLDKGSLKLNSNTSEDIDFTITVPSNASVGEHNACIAIQPIEPPTASDVNGVTLSFRSATRVAITIPGDFNKQLNFESITITSKEKNRLVVNEALRNLGNVSLDTDLNTSIKTLFGFVLEKNGGQYPILARQNAEFNFEFKKPFWGGFYTVDATATYDNNPKTSLGEKSESKETIRIKKTVFFMPNPLALLVYLVILLGAIAPFVKRKLHQKKILELKSKATTHKAKKGESITAISNIYSSNWKQVASLNGLKAPYHLEQGQEILVVPGANYEPPKKATKSVRPKKSTTSKKSANKSSDSTKKATKTTKKKPAKKKTTKPKSKNNKE